MSLLNDVCEKIFMSPDELLNFSRSMPRRYKKYEIKKRSGKGTRQIAQPSSESKFIQRIVLGELRKILPVHTSAMAYEPNVGIKKNALLHKNSKFLLKMDFKNFFPSITPSLFFLMAGKMNIDFQAIDAQFLEDVLFWKSSRQSELKLSIGAPTSPFISNFVMHSFDDFISGICENKEINYTRYADDLTFTTHQRGILFDLPVIVRKALKDHCDGKIKINREKTLFSSKRFNRHVTGIVLANDNSISLGRERKRAISSMVHKFSLGELSVDESSRLKGLLSFAHHIEPIFIFRMKNKYGEEVVDSIFSYECKQILDDDENYF